MMKSTSISSQPVEQTRTKLLQIFQYVQAFNQLQNPVQRDIQSHPWVLWWHELPKHGCIRRGSGSAASSTIATAQQGDESRETDENEEPFILKVKKPALTDPPVPPRELANWLQDGWQKIDGTVVLHPTFAQTAEQAPRLRQMFEAWQVQRNSWVQTEQPARQAEQLYKKLYDLHAQLERESERFELMIGDGILRWNAINGSSIHHPLLLLRLQLHFDPGVPEFTIVETDHPTELYTALFRDISEANETNIGESRHDFEQNHWHPLGGTETNLFLQQLIHQLSPHGAFVERSRQTHDAQAPTITRAPVLFLRTRTTGFSRALEAILEDLPTRTDFSVAFSRLAGIDAASPPTEQEDSDGTVRSFSPNGEDEQILLSKPANSEQLEIARRLEQHGAVLVQGPPGTGKTHTIANLLGHLLAQGKSVLVTSHTSKALRVLHEKIVTPLQPLCVSMLEDDSRQQMEKAIDGITERLSFSNVGELEREARQLTQQRTNILQQLRTTRQRLKEARNSEYEPIVIMGQHYPPTEAARELTSCKVSDGWLLDSPSLDTPLPLSNTELAELYRTNATVTQQDEMEMVRGLPDPQTLLSASDFTHLVQEMQELNEAERLYRSDLWQATPSTQGAPAFEELQRQMQQAVAFLRQLSTPWQREATAAGREGGLRKQSWTDLITKIRQVKELASQAQLHTFDFELILPDGEASLQLAPALDQIIAHLEAGKKLSTMVLLRHNEWKTVLNTARVRGRKPETLEEFRALKVVLQVKVARKELVRRWQLQMTPLGGMDTPATAAFPEQSYYQYVAPLHNCLTWYTTTWEPLEQALKQHGLLWEKLLAEMPLVHIEHADLARLATVVQYLPALLSSESKRRAYARHEEKWRALKDTLDAAYNTSAQADIARQLRQAVLTRNISAYSAAIAQLLDLQERQKELRRRHLLLTKLEQSAPFWASAIRRREGIHGKSELPGNPEKAWLWKQLFAELERRAQVSLEELQQRIARLSKALQDCTAELVEKKAWAAQIRRTTTEQRRALQGWKDTMRKLGKGTGKRVPRLLAEARKLMPRCQTAVPVWIMPLSRCFETFDPKQIRFDVVIVDEASQADLKALAALYIGKQIVIVGDDEQVTPEAVGRSIAQVDKLIDEHLRGIPNYHLYDEKQSIYGLAKDAAFEPVCLREHFRCVSPIIQFSNALSYHGKIRPLRDDSDVKRYPPTVDYRVRSMGSTGKLNKEEALAVVSLLIAACEQPEYKDATFGVISMVSSDMQQANAIDTLLRRYLPETEYARRRILCGKPAQFQGDERDVMFLSLVDTSPDGGPLHLHHEERDMYKKRFNVAASRARDQMWVVHSLDPETQLKDDDIRKKLILHARNSSVQRNLYAEQEARTDSEFERRVLRMLTQAGYHVISQWPVGAYRIDLVVEGAGKRLAVECDGERYHTPDRLEADMARQAILERLGWRFVRIRGSQFFRNPERALEPLFARLHELDIPAQSLTAETSAPQKEPEEELKNRIIRRAAELRNEWEQSSAKVVPMQQTRSRDAATLKTPGAAGTTAQRVLGNPLQKTS